IDNVRARNAGLGKRASNIQRLPPISCVGLRLPVISTSSEHEAIPDQRTHEFLQSLRLAVEQVIDRSAPLRLRHMGFNLISLQDTDALGCNTIGLCRPYPP